MHGYFPPISQTIQVRRTHKRRSLMNYYEWTHQCHPNSKDLHQDLFCSIIPVRSLNGNRKLWVTDIMYGQASFRIFHSFVFFHPAKRLSPHTPGTKREKRPNYDIHDTHTHTHIYIYIYWYSRQLPRPHLPRVGWHDQPPSLLKVCGARSSISYYN